VKNIDCNAWVVSSTEGTRGKVVGGQILLILPSQAWVRSLACSRRPEALSNIPLFATPFRHSIKTMKLFVC
jgi:hypothetical protein